jgi:hypothetical protein
VTEFGVGDRKLYLSPVVDVFGHVGQQTNYGSLVQDRCDGFIQDRPRRARLVVTV